MTNFTLDTLAIGGENPYAAPTLPKESVILHSEFPEVLDNTAREQFFSCPQKFFRSTIQKLAPAHQSVHLHFGGAYAAGLEAMRKAFYTEGKLQEEALAIGIEAAVVFFGDYQVEEGSSKNAGSLVGALISYIDEYPLASDPIKPAKIDGLTHAVEFTFATPIPDCFHPVTGNPILYAGRFDMLAEFQGTLFVEDDKTTGQLGATWPKQWRLNSQFTGYCWAAQQYGFPVAGAIIRGQSILKKGFGHAQVIIYRPQWMIDRWLVQLQADIARMIECWKASQFDYAIGGACSHYGGCEFLSLCEKENPTPWIQTDFVNRHWDPLAKDPEAV